MIFRAELTEEEGADNRLLAHTGAYTDILAEYFDSSNRAIPAPGYRLLEFHSADGSGSSTHYRTGHWFVVRVEEYPTAIPTHEFEAIVVGYCKYLPVQSPLMVMPKAQIAIDSFGDESVYQEFLESDTVKNYTPV
ncbi:MAG: hypothetical protein JGK21_15635 [Microcoleus sp. PH2017_22_RUC_O_B]|nr:hypothetical protein [Microcoleus sp. PH2017_21_RUC_O_A]MCC3541774.1 hypothetical protein [Microcoleus sp. PH2017_22_RUC_O_B]